MVILSRSMADAAAKDPLVEGFRREFLGERLLAPEEVEPWIKRLAEAEGEPTSWLTIPLPEGHRLVPSPADGIYVEPSLRLRQIPFPSGPLIRVLDYGVPDNDWRRCVPVTQGGTLDRLRTLSQELTQRYDWREAAATLFVLTGGTPLSSPLEMSVNATTSPFKRRIVTLEIDPMLSPREVARNYSEIRRRLTSGRRQRGLGEKHLTLAGMIAGASEEPWATRLQRWNKAHPKWKYLQESNFRRDCLKARERILAPASSADRVFGAIAEPAAVNKGAGKRVKRDGKK